MSEEASQILAMVADGKITADEAVNLLKALTHQDTDRPREIRVGKVLHGDGCHCVGLFDDGEVPNWWDQTDHA